MNLPNLETNNRKVVLAKELFNIEVGRQTDR